MKKYLAVMAVAAAALAASATPSHAFTSFKISTVTAVATTGGANIADFTLNAANVTSPTVLLGTTTLNWATFDPLTTTWALSSQVLVINSTVTDNGGGIKIYTDNTNGAIASPRFSPPTAVSTAPTSVAAGLVKSVPGGVTSAAPLPLAWTIKAAAGTPTVATPGSNPDGFQWLFVTDKSNWANGTDFNGDGDTNDAGDAAPLALDAKYVTMINSLGIHFGGADTEFGAHPDGANAWIYVEANFAGADVLQTYRTSALLVEAFLQ